MYPSILLILFLQSKYQAEYTPWGWDQPTEILAGTQKHIFVQKAFFAGSKFLGRLRQM
jgi:hypothetical protein